MRKLSAHGLTRVPNGPTLASMVRALREDRFPERMLSMKTSLRACLLALKKNDPLHPALSRGYGAAQTRARQEQYRYGQFVRRVERSTVAQVHGCGCQQPQGHGYAHAVLRDGPDGAGLRDDGAHSEPDARSGRYDRVGQGVTPRLPQNPSAFVNQTLREIALASSSNAAADVVADALLALALLAHSVEVHHG
ncbi:hypothetical protein AWB74_04877 [Caballeronia arvi]|uniref:Uncharacterized protein n=1 Tax=Caballeronia arvi TaxID=1777135 RepID=A0A158K3V8_9BURK|nr:hypothetical protein AWB74_04877 [Caballeronia arvi]